MADINFETQELAAIKDSPDVTTKLLMQLVGESKERQRKNGSAEKKATFRLAVAVLSILIPLVLMFLGGFWKVSGWKTETDHTKDILTEQCGKFKTEKITVWDRLEADRQERVATDKAVIRIDGRILNMESSQQRIESKLDKVLE